MTAIAVIVWAPTVQSHKPQDIMTAKPTIKGQPVHHLVEMHAREFQEGKLSRREFMARSTALQLDRRRAPAVGRPPPVGD